MQKTFYICCLLSVLFLSSCGFYEHRQRQVLCTQIKTTNDSLDRLTRNWHDALEKAMKTRNFSGLMPLRIQLAQFLSRRRSVIADLELPADAEALRGSEGMFLSSQVAVVTDVYPRFEQFNDLTPDSALFNRVQLVAGDVQTELSWKLTIKRALDAFAAKNGIKNMR
jgi:hypothetical protein